jgi:hypothetical protein
VHWAQAGGVGCADGHCCRAFRFAHRRGGLSKADLPTAWRLAASHPGSLAGTRCRPIAGLKE